MRATRHIPTALRRIFPLVLAVTLFALLPIGLPGLFSGAVRQILTTTLLFGFAAFAWNVLSGYLGYLSLGDYLYFGLSAYACAYFLTIFGISPLFTVLPAALVAAAIAACLSRLVAGLRFRGSIFALVTLAVAEIGKVIITHIPALKGEAGIYLPLVNEPRNFLFIDPINYYYWALALLAFGGLLSCIAFYSRWGVQLMALRDEEVAARSLGIRIDVRLSQAAAGSAAAFAFAGAFYGASSFFVTPSTVLSIDIVVTVLIICMVGGIGRVWAPLYGLLIIASVQIALNKAGLSSTTAATWGHMTYGAIILIAVIANSLLSRSGGFLKGLGGLVSRRPDQI
jgi:branched-chain amino acid transport system permease protein